MPNARGRPTQTLLWIMSSPCGGNIRIYDFRRVFTEADASLRYITEETVEVQMLSKWMCGNKVAMRVVASAAGMTALAVVVAAPGKWT
jgi:hypothetical protein